MNSSQESKRDGKPPSVKDGKVHGIEKKTEEDNGPGRDKEERGNEGANGDHTKNSGEEGRKRIC